MGCDIHMVIEKWNGGRWQFHKALDVGRNYGLFAALAGVRREQDNWPKLSEPRGLPLDCDPESLEENFDEGPNKLGHAQHSHSWFLLSEIRNWNWDQKVSYNTLIPLRASDVGSALHCREPYEVWCKTSPHKPDGGEKRITRSTPNIGTVIIEQFQAPQYLAMTEAQRELFAPGCHRAWVSVSWSESIKEFCREFLVLVVHSFQYADGHDYRVLFGFDN